MAGAVFHVIVVSLQLQFEMAWMVPPVTLFAFVALDTCSVRCAPVTCWVPTPLTLTMLETVEGGRAARPRRRVEERSARRPLLHRRSVRHGATWTSRAGGTPLPSREL